MTKSQRTRQRAVMISSVIARKSKTGTKPAETLDLSKAANLGAFRWPQSRSSRSVRRGGIRRRRRLIPTNIRQSKTPADGRGDLPTPFRYSSRTLKNSEFAKQNVGSSKVTLARVAERCSSSRSLRRFCWLLRWVGGLRNGYAAAPTSLRSRTRL
jgi:hypothetical protein